MEELLSSTKFASRRAKKSVDGMGENPLDFLTLSLQHTVKEHWPICTTHPPSKFHARLLLAFPKTNKKLLRNVVDGENPATICYLEIWHHRGFLSFSPPPFFLISTVRDTVTCTQCSVS